MSIQQPSNRAVFIVLVALVLWLILLLYLPQIWGLLNAELIGGFLLYVAFDALKTGSVRIRAAFDISEYDCRRNPIAFWFYVTLFSFVGLCACVLPVYWLYFRKR